MLKKLLLLFILVPTVELILLVQVGQWMGTLPTIGLIILTGSVGAYLAGRQGIQVWNRLRAELRTGRLPAGAVQEGVMILVAGVLLMTPGVLTDIVGLLCLIPASRRVIKPFIWTWLGRWFRNGKFFTVSPWGAPFRNRTPEDVIIIDPDDYSSRRA